MLEKKVLVLLSLHWIFLWLSGSGWDSGVRRTHQRGVTLTHAGLDVNTSSKSSFPSSICEAAASSPLLKVEAISERCKLLSPLLSCQPRVESSGWCSTDLGQLKHYLASVAFHSKSSVTGSTLACFSMCIFILPFVKYCQPVLMFLNPHCILAAALAMQKFPRIHGDEVSLTYSHHIILLRAVGISQCYRSI